MKQKYSSNLRQITQKLIRQLKVIAASDKIQRQAAFDAQSLVLSRVQQQGRNASGQQMGRYSSAYAKVRSKKGRQSSYKDLTFSGDMIRDFQVDPIGRNSYGVGFGSRLQGDKARYNEAREGLVFELTDDEIETVQQGIEDTINKILNS